MEMIVISKENFNLAFQACLDRLNLETLREKEYMMPNYKSEKLIALHRKFHYEITGLRDQLEKG